MVTRGSRQDHEKKLFDVLNKLEKAGYRASKKKSEFFMNRIKWLGHEIDENGIKPNEEKVKAILKLKPPENTKKLKSFLGAIQYMAKFLGTNRPVAETIEKERTMEMGRRTTERLRKNKTNVNRRPMFSTLRKR